MTASRVSILVDGDKTELDFFEADCRQGVIHMDTCLAAELAAEIPRYIRLDADEKRRKKEKEKITRAAFERDWKLVTDDVVDYYLPRKPIPIAPIPPYDFGDTPVSQMQWRTLVDKFNLLLDRLGRP